MPITTARARLVIDYADRRAAILGAPAAIAVVDQQAQLVGCVRLDGAAACSLDTAVTNACAAASAYFGEHAAGRAAAPGVELVPAWNFTTTSPPRYEAVMAVVADSAQESIDIARKVVSDITDFDARHRQWIS